MITITSALVRELAESPAIGAALVRNDDGTYAVRSTVRDCDGNEPSNGYEVVATRDGLADSEFEMADVEQLAHVWQAAEADRMDRLEAAMTDQERRNSRTPITACTRCGRTATQVDHGAVWCPYDSGGFHVWRTGTRREWFAR
jgi:hypothetical protein